MNDEVLGIVPGPEKMETLLDAMSRSAKLVYYGHPKHREKLERQEAAFRARILARDKEKDKRIEQWEIFHGFHMGDEQMIETITEKDKRIDKLNDRVFYLRRDLEEQKRVWERE